mmetsp:Transcript_23650/g.51243  ORF Transcript_23650/g.51243 Transcript_23650/m.51243 type:complete len:358 (+) Transcript_23650:412-1485(+)|eukprot:CAMPEP_0178525188 /NCGR_PEP_ID=MMETSP0696-20121128/30047_1 /TAXON_ID=265572 /ORGANISM="Extubocellulus spinifer, Strain CCMP396" /LENGTH=357 /DNA_ID=CAMNT_0020156581 /DNA_START=302 /DNA_END=1375 /DNA_ORIENTATION=-
MKTFKTFSPRAVTVALAAVAIAYMYKSFGLDPRIVLRVGWRTGWLPKKIMKLYSHPTDDPSIPPFYYPAFFMSTGWYRNEVLHWVPRKNDVVVATFPKSGTHLMSQLIAQTVEGGESEFDTIHNAVVLIEGESVSPKKCGDDPDLLSLENYKEKMVADGDRRGVLITHLPVSTVAKPESGAMTIVMMRDPLDTLASLRSMLAKTMGPGAPTMEEAFEYMFQNIAGGWAEYNLQWWEEAKRRPDEVLILFYEDALTNLTDTVVKAAEFLGESTEPDVVELIRYKSTMEYMKSEKEKFDPPLCSMPAWMRPKGGTMVNKGKAGAGKKKASQELQEAMRKYVRESLSGTDFPLDRFHSLS